MNFLTYPEKVNKLYKGIMTSEDRIWLANLSEERIAKFKGALYGTTIMGVKAKDAVIMAGDTRVSISGPGGGVVSDKFDKILDVDKRTLIAIAGTAGWAKEFVRAFRSEVRIFQDIHTRELSTKGKVRRLARLTGQFLAPAIQLGMIVIPILGTFDSKKGPQVFRISIDQSYIEKDWLTEGSGGVDARGVLKDRYRKDLSREEAIDLVKRALESATTDLYTGPKRTIKVIDKDGISIIEGV